ncbi:MAG: 2-oxoacid:acceptor oxidoreductase subunit alpha [Prevotellaceae bacterium]|jgi:2-oxoglutarate ferredoxin oxidoreductase subunit alpha|nr:2-oxoacid:acceptor oxidoreductase subunit alpha [Prevotellaceae bacterium]
MGKQTIETNDVVIRFSGDSGDGMQLTGTLFADTAALLGKGISTFPDYPAEIRAPQGTVAGVSGFQVHVGSGEVKTPGDFCDVLIAMNPAALKANARWTKPTASIIVDSDLFDEKNIQRAGFKTENPFTELKLDDRHIIYAPISELTKEALKDSGLDRKVIDRCKNMFALGICFYMFNEPLTFAEEYFDRKFKKKPELIVANKAVLKAGYNYAGNVHAIPNTYKIPTAQKEKGVYRNINGNQATAWGLIAASEKSGLPLFCGSYPITPATNILEELAARKDLGVKTLQAEDEIAGICTAIGASFAGNLAVTSTSGPGLSLKSEAIGLAVMTELPLVIVDVQRGGPSTGLPTKTEQADLMQALWGRNGECPLVVIAASTPSDCFNYAFQAAKIAMEHMTPVMLLTDGFIANGSQPWRIPAMKDFPEIHPPIVPEGTEGYLPYARDEKRLARRWVIPGTKGLEHRIGGLEKDFLKGSASTDPENHQRMVEIRAAKVARVQDFIPKQEIFGDESGDVLVVGWGGTYGHLYSAVNQLRKEGQNVSLAHFNYINPLPSNTGEIFKRFKKIIVCELNMGQFANYLRMIFSHFDYLQYNKVQGLPFSVSELMNKIKEISK